MDMEVYIFVAVAGFVASFIDAAAGGGGMISLPALLLTGISPLHALGTNKMAAVMGACTSFITFVRSGKMDVQLIKKLFPLSLIGSALGVLAVQQVPSEFLRPLIVVLLVAVVLYSLLKKDWDRDTEPRKLTGRMLALSMLVALVMGFYDGFFGPGTGSFLLFAFLMLGFDFIGAT
ncbi:TSUP family transporter, partial [Anaerovibrio slackiae]